MNYGDLGKRMVASILDSIFLFVIGLFVGWISVLSGLWPLVWILSPLINWLYYILMEGGSAHATLGKKIMGLYVADEDGRGITYSKAVLRVLGKMLSGLTFGIGLLLCFFNDSKQCLHDMIAKTYVLNGTEAPHGNGDFLGQAAGMPQLVGISGPMAGRVFSLGGEGLMIGRDHLSCHVVIPSAYRSVSRTHCFITFNPASGMFILNDRQSTAGTYLMNGSRVPASQPIALRSGDRFYVATQENTFEVR